MTIGAFLGIIRAELDVDFFAGVPDSQLKALCNYLLDTYGVGKKHIVAANEGAAVGLAAGHYLSSGKPALVYMQNSGIGNAVNPICSLLSDRVYGIPVLFVVGWRGEPGIKDEPQHRFQGEITLKQLDCLEIPYTVLDKETDEAVLKTAMQACRQAFSKGHSYAVVVRKDALTYAGAKRNNERILSRERAVEIVLEHTDPNSVFVSTTGKLSRELFELRNKREEDHRHDFLTVGSMGHSLMIAAGIASDRPEKSIFCLDGDGAVLMHTGSMAVVGQMDLPNLVHIMMNNGAHETVGGIPTVADGVDWLGLAKACGYRQAFTADDERGLLLALKEAAAETGPVFIEIKVNLSARSDLGRPTSGPKENRDAFMEYIKGAM